MHDSLASGKTIRTLNIIDDFNREALTINADYSQSGRTVVSALEDLKYWRGRPIEIRCDNGPEFLSNHFVDYCQTQGIHIKYIQPGKPTQNAYIERFNRTVRYDWLAQELFDTIDDVQDQATRWMWHYNHERPNMALGGITPKQRLAMAA